MAAKVPGKKGDSKPVTKGKLRQALNMKLNQMIFTKKRPSYHKEKYKSLKAVGAKEAAEKPPQEDDSTDEEN